MALSCAGSSGFASAGSDGRIQLWTLDMVPSMGFDLFAVGSLNVYVQSLVWDASRHLILISTRGSEIFEISDQDGTPSQGRHGPLLTVCISFLLVLLVPPPAFYF